MKTKFFGLKNKNFVRCRVLHSEAYIRYIEGLTKESKSMCNWDRQLSTASEVREYVVTYSRLAQYTEYIYW
jgi:hypothetical protein